MQKYKTSSQLVVDQRAWPVFLITFFLALVLGLSFRAVFSSGRIGFELQKILTESRPNADVQFRSAELILSGGYGGFFPRFALLVQGLSIKSYDPCLFYAQVGVDRLEIPLPLKSLFVRQFSIARLSVNKMKAQLFEVARGECLGLNSGNSKVMQSGSLGLEASEAGPSQENMDKGDGVVRTNPTLEQGPKELSGQRLNQPLVQTLTITAPLLEKVLINELAIETPYISEASLFGKNLNILAIKGDGSGNFRAFFDFEIVHKGASTPLVSRVQLEHFSGVRSRLEVKGYWREGTFVSDNQFDLVEKTWLSKNRMKYLPIEQLFLVLKSMGVNISTTTKAFKTWIGADFTLKGKLDQDFLHGELEEFNLDGELGRVTAQAPIEFLLQEKGFVFPRKAEFFLKHFKFHELVSLTGVGGESLFSDSVQLGDFTGPFELSGQGDMSVKGVVENFQVPVANRGRRGLLTLKSAKFNLEKTRQKIFLSLSEFRLNEGELEGLAELNLFPQELGNYAVKVNGHLKWRPGDQMADVLYLKTPLDEPIELAFEIRQKSVLNGQGPSDLQHENSFYLKMRSKKLALDPMAFENLNLHIRGSSLSAAEWSLQADEFLILFFDAELKSLFQNYKLIDQEALWNWDKANALWFPNGLNLSGSMKGPNRRGLNPVEPLSLTWQLGAKPIEPIVFSFASSGKMPKSFVFLKELFNYLKKDSFNLKSWLQPDFFKPAQEGFLPELRLERLASGSGARFNLESAGLLIGDNVSSGFFKLNNSLSKKEKAFVVNIKGLRSQPEFTKGSED